jgi:hypothetical protein
LMPIFRACVVSARSDGLLKVAADPTFGKKLGYRE